MDRLGQAEAILASIADGGPVVVAGRAASPMDCQRTIPVARSTIDACQAAAGTPVPAVLDPEMLRAAAGVDPHEQDRRPA